jgi:hypothetical protein
MRLLLTASALVGSGLFALSAQDAAAVYTGGHSTTKGYLVV